jgi:predicted enzyme related to lactoylglutathione lyase
MVPQDSTSSLIVHIPAAIAKQQYKAEAVMAKSIFWFEIPAADIDRAIHFYSQIFGTELQKMEVNEGYPMAMLPESLGGGGAIVQGDIYQPTGGGVLIYLNAGEQFDAIYERIPAAGGKIAMEKVDMGGHGVSAFFIDSEGNKIGLAATT